MKNLSNGSTSLPRTLASMWQCFWQTSEHMPNDTRLQTFLELRECALTTSSPSWAASRIMGSAKRIERVYFEISESSQPSGEAPGQGIQKAIYIWRGQWRGERKRRWSSRELLRGYHLWDAAGGSDIRVRSEMRGQRTKRRVRRRSRRSRVRGWVSFPSWRSSPPVCPQVQYLTLMRMLSLKSLKKQVKKVKKMTVKDMITAFTSYWVFWWASRTCSQRFQRLLRIIGSLLLGGSLVKVQQDQSGGALGQHARPHARWGSRRRGGGGEENLEGALPSEDLTDLKELTEESDLLSDIFWLGPEAKGGSTNWFLTIPMLAWVTMSNPQSPIPEVQEKFQVTYLQSQAALWTSGGHDRWTWHQLFCLCQSGVQ